MKNNDLSNLICGNESPNWLGFDFNNTPDLLFYSYIPIVILILTFSTLVRINNRNDVVSDSFLSFSIYFILWVINILIQWTSSIHLTILVSWKLTIFFEILLLFYSVQLSYSIIFRRKIVSSIRNLVIAIALLMIPLKSNISDYNYNECEGVLGYIWNIIYTIEPIIIVAIVITSIYFYLRRNTDDRKYELIILNLGIVIFLAIFYLSNIYSEIVQSYEFNFYGPIGIIVLIGIFSYSIIKYNTFKISRFSSKILIICLVISITSLFFIRSIGILNIITPITFLSILIFSALLTLTIQASYDLEMKAHRELKKLSDTKDQFVSLAQHNLRVPINSIANNLKDILAGKYGAIDSKTAAAIEDTIQASDSLRHTADDLKDIAKMKIGSQILDIKSTNLLSVLKEVIQDLKLDIKNMEITLSYPTDDSYWPEVKVDQNKIRDVFIVIIENAIKYNKKGGTIDITTTKEDGLEIKITNTGIGITKDEHDSILSKSFYRSQRVKETNPTGMGIGLFLSKLIVEAHHGSLNINSKGLNRGAEVTILLQNDFLNNLDI